VYCWGDSSDGPIVPNSSEITVTPQLIFRPPGPYRDLAAGGDYVCGIRWSGMGECWGRGEFGELGNGKRQNSSFPVGIVR
jgi:hypothetical protein